MEQKREAAINRSSIRFKILAIVLSALFILTFALGYFSFQFSKNRIVTMLGDSLKAMSSSIAAFIPPENVSFILQNTEAIKRSSLPVYDRNADAGLIAPRSLDENPAAGVKTAVDPKSIYHNYCSLLADIKKINKIDSSINIYMVSNNRLILAMTSEPAYLVGASYLIRPEAAEAISSGTAKATGIYRDRVGRWISAYAPGARGAMQDKRVVVEVNYKVDSYLRILRRELGIIALICLAGFLLVAFVSYNLITVLASAINRLDEAAKDLEHERYDKPIDVRTNDEIGHLSKTFELLRLSIKDKIEQMRLAIKRERKAHLDSVVALTNAIEERDSYTKKHVSRVQEYALLIAKHMKLNHIDMVQLRYSCYLHDIGKIYIEQALLKKVNLTHEDFDEIKKHSGRGAKIIEGIEFLADVKDAVLYHHEWWNGKGYPKGLKGTEIPLLARIVAVADAFDAMTTDRPYRPKMDFKSAMAEVEKRSGEQFDPDVCAAFLYYRDTLEEMARKHFQT